jgi:hypothetical protein
LHGDTSNGKVLTWTFECDRGPASCDKIVSLVRAHVPLLTVNMAERWCYIDVRLEEKLSQVSDNIPAVFIRVVIVLNNLSSYRAVVWPLNP